MKVHLLSNPHVEWTHVSMYNTSLTILSLHVKGLVNSEVL
jgi:hypothetical protein